MTKEIKQNVKETEEQITLDILERADRFAEDALSGLKRKRGEEFAIDHGRAVSRKLAEWGFNEKIQAAGLLHDIVEDTETKPEDIEKHFGKEVLDIVMEVTHDKTLNYDKKERNRQYADQLRNASIESCFVKMADIIHNIGDFLNPKLWDDEKRREIHPKYASFRAALFGNINNHKKQLEIALREFNEVFLKLEQSIAENNKHYEKLRESGE